jgi:MSHA biogenesis protein MshI
MGDLVFGFKRASAAKGWIGCAPQGAHAAFALVQTAAGSKPVVHWASREPWTDPEQTLRRLRRSRTLQAQRRVAVLQRHQYQCMTMDAPADVPRPEWAAAMRWQLREAVEFAVDTAAVDVLAVPAGASYRPTPQVIAVAAAEAQVRPLVGTGLATGLPWQAIDVAETALRNLGLLVAPPDRAQALMHCGPEHATLVVTWQGELLSTRQIDLALLDVATQPGAARQDAFEHAALELQRTLDGIERAFGQVTMSQLLITPMPGQEALCNHLRPLLYVPVLPLDLHRALDWRSPKAVRDDPALLNAVTVAIGAALRED